MSLWQRLVRGGAFAALGTVALLAAAHVALAEVKAVPPEPAVGAVVSIVKVVMLFVVMLLAAAAGNWLAKDAANQFDKQREQWYGMFLAGVAAALALVLAIPIIYIGFPLALAAIAGPMVYYVKTRNAQVAPRARVFTPEHIRRSLQAFIHREDLSEIAADRAVHLSGVQHISEKFKLLYMDNRDFPIHLTPQTDEERAAFEKAEAVLNAALVREGGAIYLVPHGQETLIRLRVGGTIRDAGKVNRQLGDGIMRFIKQLAGLDAEEHRKPQGGRFVILREDKRTNITVETAGSTRGEQLTAKLYRRELLEIRLGDSGMRPEQVELLSKAFQHPGGGIILMSGPARSGRTISMYSALREYDLFSKNVIAVESSLSLEHPAVNQVEVDKAAGQTLADAIQAALRSDPDVVMVETLRDADSAKMLMLGATAGKIMIGGLAANDAGEAVKKFMAAVGDPKSVAAVLLASVNQRLMRKLCPGCCESYRPNPEFLRKANLQGAKLDVLKREPKNRPRDKEGKEVVCPICGNEAYVGRTAVYELMVLDDGARQQLAAGKSLTDIRTELRKKGQEFLQEEALRRVVEGTTSVSELLRILKPEK
ncbi:MAG: Flp pilus assembly complex ATPase component TadA [Planctomycetes bacterium]|nr:Flp pilus assembly complex ATPase component TadA [Planctomycetota bacterium]